MNVRCRMTSAEPGSCGLSAVATESDGRAGKAWLERYVWLTSTRALGGAHHGMNNRVSPSSGTDTPLHEHLETGTQWTHRF